MDSLLKELSAKQRSMLAEQEATNNIISKSFDGVSMQLSGASHTLAILGITLGLFGFGIGVYVTYAQYQVYSIYSKNKLLLIESEKIKKEVEELNELMQSYIPKLYKQIKREEIVSILEGLSERPENIINNSSFLLTQTLQKEDFEKLLSASNRLLMTATDNSMLHEMKMQYCTILAQNFTYESMMKDSFKNEFLDKFWQVLRRFFIVDIQNSLEGFGRYMKVKTIERIDYEIDIYFRALETAIHQPSFEIYNPLISKLDKNERLSLLKVLDTKKDQLPKVYNAFKVCLDEVERGE